MVEEMQRLNLDKIDEAILNTKDIVHSTANTREAEEIEYRNTLNIVLQTPPTEHHGNHPPRNQSRINELLSKYTNKSRKQVEQTLKYFRSISARVSRGNTRSVTPTMNSN